MDFVAHHGEESARGAVGGFGAPRGGAECAFGFFQRRDLDEGSDDLVHGTVGDAGAHDGEEFDARVVAETEGHRFAGPCAGKRAGGQGGLGRAADFIGQFALNVGGREAEAFQQLAAAEGGAKTRGGVVDAQDHALPQLEDLPGQRMGDARGCSESRRRFRRPW